jgi:hypothetical protein
VTQRIEDNRTSLSEDVSTFRFRPSILLLTCLLLVVAAVPWRRGTFFSGGTDVVVVTKAGLTVLAVTFAWLMPRKPDTWARFLAAPAVWLGLYLTTSVLGGVVNGDGYSSAILAIRLALMALALLLLTVSHPWQAVVSAMSSAMLLLAMFSSITGISSLPATGRLYGGIPPINANAICLLISVPVALLFWKSLYARARRIEYVMIIALLGVIWLTGARTGLAALIVALMIMLVLAPRVPTPTAVGVVAAIPVMLYVTFFTPVLIQFAGRGDPAGVTTLNSRTVAWTAALNYAETLPEKLIGSGLALKQIPVTALYRSEQILDSTWISALIQVGYVGVGVLLLLVLSTLIKALGLPRSERALIFPLTAMVTIVSVLESGMFDTAAPFLVFFTMSVLAHRVRDRPLEPAPSGQLGLPFSDVHGSELNAHK